ncbi:hypothetical protein ABVT39_003112 [Epinephelus coioides]
MKKSQFNTDASLLSDSSTACREQAQIGFPAAYDLQSELRQEAEISAPNDSGSSSSQEQSIISLLCQFSLIKVLEAAVSICGALFFTVPQQKCHIDDDTNGTTLLM